MIRIVYGGGIEGKQHLASLRKRSEGIQKDTLDTVNKILEEVKSRGDEAVAEYTRIFDCSVISADKLLVSKQEIKESYEKVDKDYLDAIDTSICNVREFHEKQKQKSWMMTKEDGIVLGQTIRALESVGIYVPGGTASYPSSVIMNAIPAKTAGVKSITMTTPPQKDGTVNPYILTAADKAGVDIIYKAGGVQAIGAMAFGTEVLSKVDKIVGPGNIYVAMAKKSVFGYVDIDMIAGPSEILVIADDGANEKYIAADLMSQAEHDRLSSAILITTSGELAKKVKQELEYQVESLERSEIIKSSLTNYGLIMVVESIKEALETANAIAPEHIELMVKDPFSVLGNVKNAGSIFLGEYSPEPLGDYIAGPNHVLPTSGTARFFSPLSVDDFIKKSSFMYYTEKALMGVKNKITKIADVEGLTAHANSIKVRFKP